jgi:hypothetical protein
MINIIHQFECDYCGAIQAEKMNYPSVNLEPIRFYTPKGWSIIDGKLACQLHVVTVKNREEK